MWVDLEICFLLSSLQLEPQRVFHMYMFSRVDDTIQNEVIIIMTIDIGIDTTTILQHM